MNLGQQIYAKSENNQSINEEIKKIEQIITQISQNEKQLPDIDFKLFSTKDFSDSIKDYIKLADEAFNIIKHKYFKPNGFEIRIYVSAAHFYIYSEICVDSTIMDTQLKLDIINDEDNDEDKEYDWSTDLFNIWNDELFNKLLTALNISELAIMIGTIWYDDEFEFQNIEVNYERD